MKTIDRRLLEVFDNDDINHLIEASDSPEWRRSALEQLVAVGRVETFVVDGETYYACTGYVPPEYAPAGYVPAEDASAGAPAGGASIRITRH